MRKYLIDTNIFIESSNRHYAIDICPGFWEFLDRVSDLENVKSITQVYDEFTPDNEELVNFKERLKNKGFFLQIENITPESYSATTISLQKEGYNKQAIDNFSQKADYFLIALALQEQYTIVTQEARMQTIPPNAPKPKRIKIPNVCEQLEIECIDIIEFLRRERAIFVLRE